MVEVPEPPEAAIARAKKAARIANEKDGEAR